MNVALGSDHAGFRIKERLKSWLQEHGHAVRDLGTDGPESVDYPDFAEAVGGEVAAGEAEFGVLVCGTGIGMSIAANKVPGARAAVCADIYSAKLARGHNDANILCVGARVTGPEHIEEILATFLETGFEGGRHQRRIDKIHRQETVRRAGTEE